MLLWLALVFAVLLFFLLILLYRQKKQRTLESQMVQRARTMALYQALYPILQTAEHCCVDRVLIRRDEVRIVLFKPMNRVFRFVFEERGFDKITNPQVLKVLALAISSDMEHLRDSKCYSFDMRQDMSSSGEKVIWYEYNITPRYKDMLTKAWYSQPTVEDGIIR